MKRIVLLFTVLLTACTVGPNYVPPAVPVPVKYKEVAKGWKVAQPGDALDRGDWWKIFRDPKLNALEAQLMHCNQSVAVAEAQYFQARALVNEARASFFPSLAGSVGLQRQKQGGGSTSFVSTSSGGVISSGSATTGSSGASNVFTNHSWNLDAAWEPDLWGSVRRSVEASTAGAAASAAQLASVRLASQATLAQTYFQLRALDKDQQILDDTVNEYQQSLALTRNRYASGVAGYSDVVQARTQLDNAKALAINNRIGRAQFEHAIAVLLGIPPADLSISFAPLNAKPPIIPIEVPSALLERRPDVAQAERLAAEANAQIGVAIAAYYPSLNLTGNANQQNRNYSNWLSVPAINWSLGAQLAQTIFDGGLRKATTEAARANYAATVATYRQTVLTAFQDVEDNLVSLRILREQSVVQDRAAADARLALRLVLNQYKSGTVAYADVIIAQTTAYSAEKTAADVTGQRMTAAVGLIKALGGGW
jgi:NodT family efflux transporter outer membrane factor (OMF) lipoprotein